MGATANTYGRIDPEWAVRLESRGFDIWTHNGSRTEEISGQIRLRHLGGLTVQFTDDAYSPEQAREVDNRRTVVNLAFREHGRLTLSSFLHEAAKQRGGDDDPLAVDLRQHSRILGQPAWLIPVSAITVVDLAEIGRS